MILDRWSVNLSFFYWHGNYYTCINSVGTHHVSGEFPAMKSFSVYLKKKTKCHVVEQSCIQCLYLRYINIWFNVCGSSQGCTDAQTAARLAPDPCSRNSGRGPPADSLQLIDYNNWITWWRSDSCASAAAVCAGVASDALFEKIKGKPTRVSRHYRHVFICKILVLPSVIRLLYVQIRDYT